MRQHYIQIQNEDDPPNTNYFIYKGKQYPIKFDFFKISSKYFSDNQEEILKNKIIQLVDINSEPNYTFSENSIQCFIDYVHRQKVPINNDNVLTLNYLAKRYEINSLTKATNEYIKDYSQELVLPILLFFQNDSNFETETYETAISENLDEYINDDQILSLKMPILYRIIEKFTKNNGSKIKENKFVDFLFNCLNKFGLEASPLFTFVDFENIKTEYLNRLLSDYSNVFDFHFINSEFLKSFYQIQTSTIQSIEIMKNHFEEMKKEQEEQFNAKIKLMDDEMTALKSEQENKLNEKIRLMDDEMTALKSEQENKLNEKIKLMDDEMTALKNEQENKLNEKMRFFDDHITKFQSKIDEYKIELNEYKTQINEYKNEINNLRDELNKSKIKNDEIKECKDEIKNLTESLNQQKEKNCQFENLNKYFFNLLDGEKQKSFFLENKFLIGEENNKIMNLLFYLSDQMKISKKTDSNINYIFFPSEKISEKENDSIIGINSDVIELLFENKEIESHNFSSLIKDFSEIYIEIKHPTSNSLKIYSSILNLKKKCNANLKIGFFFTKMGNFVSENRNVNFLKFDASITEIQNGCFSGFSSLTSISLPYSIVSIERDAFKGCLSLQKVFIPSSVNFIGENAFSDCPLIDQITIQSTPKICEKAFNGCKSTVKVKTPFFSVKTEPSFDLDDYKITQICEMNNGIVNFIATVNQTGEKVRIIPFSLSHFVNLFQFCYGIQISLFELLSIVHVHNYRFPLSIKEPKPKKFNVKVQNRPSPEFCADFSDYLIVTDFLNGDVESYNKKYLKSKGKESLNPTIRSKIIFGVAATMKKLHEKGITLLNLNNSNVFLDEKFEPKIDTFSSCKSFMNDNNEFKMSLNSPFYMAPELFFDEEDISNKYADVYSYSIFLYQMFTPDFKLNDNSLFHNFHQFMSKIRVGVRPTRIKSIPDNYWELMTKCWQNIPSDRYTFNEIVDILKDDEFALEEFGMKTDLEQLHEYQKRIDPDD